MLENEITTQPKSIVSVRTDGLGGRIWSLLCTMLEAEKQGCDFKFTWHNNNLMMIREFHTLPTAEEMFSEQFLEAHYLVSLAEIGDEDVTTEGNRSNEFLAEYNGPKNLKRQFDRIGFRSPYSDAVQMAEAAKVPENAVAMHVRSGDIIFGKVRERTRFLGKTIPLPVAQSIVRDLVENGRPVIVFCQDEHSISLLVEEGAVPAAKYLPAEIGSEQERDLFEIVLMSKCSEILAGGSVFAMTACLIGQASLRNPADNFSAEEIINIVEGYCTGERRVDGHIAAHALKYIYYNFPDVLDADHRIGLIKRMRDYDPDNRLYSFILAYEFAKCGKLEDADNVLKERLYLEYEEKKRMPCKSMKLLAYPVGYESRLNEVCNTFFDNAGKGYGYIDLFAAYVLYKDKNKTRSLSIISKSIFSIDNKVLPFKLFFKCLRYK
ncbi:MAG: hypothetical protein AAF362_09805 [Pseudomonadota bacterium]